MKSPQPSTISFSEMLAPLAVCRLDANAEIPGWAMVGDFYSVTHTSDELSVVCAEDNVPVGVRCEKGWRGLKVEGPLDFGLVGILAAIAATLAAAGISLFALATFDTDYILVKADQYESAIAALAASGHTIKRRA